MSTSLHKKLRVKNLHIDSLMKPDDSAVYSNAVKDLNLFIRKSSRHLMPKCSQCNEYSLKEELTNAITHGIGAGLALIGLITLLFTAIRYGDIYHIVSAAVYGSSLILLYLASAFYHLFSLHGLKKFFQKLDHLMIYILIAGTYTPFTLVTLQGAWGWTLFSLVWGMALCGLLLELALKKRIEWLSLTFYLSMGWLLLIVIKPLAVSLATGGLILLLTGGLLYTFGVIFYVWKNLSYSHAIWHLFVMAASTAHFFAILFYVMPSAT